MMLYVNRPRISLDFKPNEILPISGYEFLDVNDMDSNELHLASISRLNDLKMLLRIRRHSNA